MVSLLTIEVTEAHRLLVSEDFSNIEEAPADMGNGTSIERDVCRTVEPIALDIQLDFLAVGKVLEVDRRLGGADREVTYSPAAPLVCDLLRVGVVQAHP